MTDIGNLGSSGAIADVARDVAGDAESSSTRTQGGDAVARSPATGGWSNQGGSVAEAEAAPPVRLRSINKALADTPGGCRERARADLAAAGLTDTVNGRLRLEHSAASWHARADLIQRLDDSFAARQRAASAAADGADGAGLARIGGRRPAVAHVAAGAA